MRPLEVALVAVLAARILWPALPRRPRPAQLDVLTLLVVVTAAAQLSIEQYRWQMLPLYLIVAALALVTVVRRLRPARQAGEDGRSRAWAAAGTLAACLGLVLLAAPPALFPVPSVPVPTGTYRVGTVSWQLTDLARKELYSGNPDEPRTFMAQAWYPADPPAGAQPAPWVQSPELVGPAVATFLHLPSFFLDHLRLSRTHSYEGAPLSAAEAEYPVLLFSHGWGGLRVQNTYQMEELASHGYVVIAAEHTYGAVLTVFPDGHAVPQNPHALPSNDGLSDADFQRAANQLVTQWSGDLGFILDSLAAPQASGPAARFSGRLDLARVGVLGHSTGGGTAIEFCGHDARCKAGLTMDAYMAPVSPALLDGGLKQPFLFMFSERWPSARNNQLFDRLYGHLSAPHTTFTIAGTSHYDFTDMPMLTPLAPYIGLKGPLPGARVLRIVDDYSVAFFDQALKGKPSALPGGPSDTYPELSFRP